MLVNWQKHFIQHNTVFLWFKILLSNDGYMSQIISIQFIGYNFFLTHSDYKLQVMFMVNTLFYFIFKLF